MPARLRYNFWRGAQAVALTGALAGFGGCVYNCNSSARVPEPEAVKAYKFFSGQINSLSSGDYRRMLEDESEHLRYREILKRAKKLGESPKVRKYYEDVNRSDLQGGLAAILFLISAGMAAVANGKKKDARDDMDVEANASK